MKKNKQTNFLILLFVILSFTTISLSEDTIYVVGDHNTWTFDSNSKAILKENLGATEYYGITISPNFEDEFKLTTDNSYTHQWGNGYWINSYDVKWNIEANGENAIWKDSTNLKNFTYLNIEKPSDYYNTNLPIGIMTLSNSPIDINSIEQIGTFSDSAYFANSDTQNVNIIISESKSTEENIYIRYTSDNWTNDNFLLTSNVNDTTYSAEIITDNLARGTIIEYYAFTTTATWSLNNDLDNFTDLMTINYNTNSGNNYKYYTNKNHPPEISSNISDTTILENNSLVLNIEATDIDNDSLTWTSENLPTGATFIDNQNGTATFTWLPNFEQSGLYENITLIVSDRNGSSSNIIISNSYIKKVK
ncbi:MAG: Ig-like domain-containing protein [Candidatus Marinimicrobia bacterium]|nr:Ig-like domain-containing protein [Candidatus Neomarinimicrobiota bacterium]